MTDVWFMWGATFVAMITPIALCCVLKKSSDEDEGR